MSKPPTRHGVSRRRSIDRSDASQDGKRSDGVRRRSSAAAATDAAESTNHGEPPLSFDGLAPLRSVIQRYELSAKKSLGQNFLLDLNLTRKIARLAGPLAGRTVIEVGPGPGGLTRALLAEGAGRVVAIERDQRCLPALAEIAERYPERLDVIEGDALEIDWQGVLAGHDGPVTIAANLPYGIATKLLIGWLESEPWPPWFDRLTLMFQREVAERITAPPGSKAYGRLAVISQWRCQASLDMTLRPEAFTPPPKVASAIVNLTPRLDPSPPCNVRTLGRVTAAVFGQRRKMLRQSLKQITPFPELLLARAGLSPEARGEQIDVAGFARLAMILDGDRTSTPVADLPPSPSGAGAV